MAVSREWRKFSCAVLRGIHLHLISRRGQVSCIKVEGEGEWNARKHGGSKRRVWRKIHIGIDEQTLEICGFRGEWALISRDAGQPFHGIVGRLADAFMESGLSDLVKRFRDGGAPAQAFT